jgi:hypothetical protein
VHYLIENKIAQHCTNVLFSALTPMPLTILPAKHDQKATISFHHLPNKIYDKSLLVINNISNHLTHTAYHLSTIFKGFGSTFDSFPCTVRIPRRWLTAYAINNCISLQLTWKK